VGGIGAIAGAMGEGDIGHALTGGIGGLAASYVHHLVRERGNATAALLLDKIGALGAVDRAVGSVDRQVARGVARATGDESVAAVRPIHELAEGGFDAMKDSVLQAVANSDDHVQTIADAAAPISQHSPNVANAFQRAALRATMYLASQLPKAPPNPSDTLMPNASNDETSDTEKAKFERIFEAVHDPTTLLTRTEDGTITPEEVNAVANTHPQMLASMREQMKDSLLGVTTPLPYSRRLAISTFLGQPVDASMSPTFVQALQGGSGKKGGSKKGTGHKGGHAKAANLPLAKQMLLPNEGSSL
jgi:hypothetical protein